MTNEQAISNLKRARCVPYKKETLTMAIKALEQEPCEDAISRQAVLEFIDKQIDHSLWAFEKLVNGIKDLPSVTPIRRTRQWVFVDKAKEHARCSECYYGDVDLVGGRPWNYCPNCGAKMEEYGMTLDEAIEHADEVAEEKKKDACELYDAENYEESRECIWCAEEHRQLAEWLKELKQLREQTKWIPVSERLPNFNDIVLASADSDYDELNVILTVYNAEEYWFNGKIKAWMPLPKPYKAESEE